MLVLRFCNVFCGLTTYAGWTLFILRYSVENLEFMSYDQRVIERDIELKTLEISN